MSTTLRVDKRETQRSAAIYPKSVGVFMEAHALVILYLSLVYDTMRDIIARIERLTHHRSNTQN